MRELTTWLRTILFWTAVLGLGYPLLMTAIAQLALPHRADGSLLLAADGTVRGSELVGQPFGDPANFWSRPSATGGTPFNGAASSGSNLGPTNPALHQQVAARIDAARAADPTASGPVPVDLVTASASGLDPHISPAAAYFQVNRVAAARGLDPARLRTMVDEHVEGRTLGILGEPRVNVVRLNLSLAELMAGEH